MPSRARRVTLLLSLAAVPPLIAAAASRDHRLPAPPRTVWDSVYSLAQAARGEMAYAKACARCHGASLTGGDEAPALTGSGFLGNWNGLPLGELETRIRTTMPSDTVGIYSRQLVIDVVAYLLKANGFPAGPAELPMAADSLKAILMRASR
jgi:mono/diheme cytochrome c family protein